MSGMNAGFAAYLAKKNSKGDLSKDRSIAPMQGQQGPMPTMNVSNSAQESLNNTKAPMTKKMPHGKAHSKVATAPKNLSHGKYL